MTPFTSTIHTRRFKFLAAAALALTLIAPEARAQFATVTALFPVSANVGDAGFTLTVNGSGFVPGSTVFWGNQALTTTFNSSVNVSAAVPASLLTTAGQVFISVTNPINIRSNVQIFTVLGAPISISGSAALPTAALNTAYTYAFTATGGTAPYTWQAVDPLPPGLALSQAGQLTGTPTTRGSFSFTVRVTDAAQRSATRVATLQVSGSTTDIANPATMPPATEGREYSVTFAVTNGTPPFRWAVGQGLPPGLTMDPATGVLRGIPTLRGNYSFNVQATDSTGQITTKSFSLTVQVPVLAITTVSPLFSGTVGTAYSQTFSGFGGTQPYTWTIVAGSIPGLQLDRTTGVLSGTPEQVGSYRITVRLTDAAGAAVAGDFTMTVDQPQLRISNNAALANATTGVPYQTRFLAEGGRPPYTWSVVAGSIPGLVLDPATGVLSQTPSSAGNFSITIAVRDSGGVVSSKTFTITVVPGALRILPATDPFTGMAGQDVAFRISAEGGVAPYTFAANGLPDGIAIDASTGDVSGRTRVPGSYPFTIRVTDGSRTSITELFQLNIAAPVLPRVSATGLPDDDRGASQLTFRVQTAEPYELPMTGQLILGFTAENGPNDPAVQFSTGGRTVDFRIPAGSTEAELPASLALQTGTVAGEVTLSARLRTEGAELTPTPLNLRTVRIQRSAPVITSAVFTRTASTVEVRISGYATTREVTRAVFRFRPTGSAQLSTSEVTMAVEESFNRWFRDSQSNAFGGQFLFTQQFNVQGDANLVAPASVTLTNSVGSTNADVRQ